MTKLAKSLSWHRIVSKLTFIAVALVVCAGFAAVVLPLRGFAQQSTGPMPENAHKAPFGSRWECNLGFRLNQGACEVVTVPENAYSTNKSYGKGWKCRRGYAELARERCSEIPVPKNAFLSTSGSTWLCYRGFRRERNSCQEIVIPENAFLSERSYGTGWECERGFRETPRGCEPVLVPKNAYLAEGKSGPGWECARGFRATASACIKIVIPANGYFSDQAYGPGWKCERGFAAEDKECRPLQLPINAHLDHSGNNWECDDPYQRRNEECVLVN